MKESTLFEKIIKNELGLCSSSSDINERIIAFAYKDKDDEINLEYIGDGYFFGEKGTPEYEEYFCAIADDGDLEEFFNVAGINIVSSTKRIKRIVDVVLKDKNSGKNYSLEMYEIPNRFGEDIDEGFLDFNTIKEIA